VLVELDVVAVIDVVDELAPEEPLGEGVGEDGEGGEGVAPEGDPELTRPPHLFPDPVYGLYALEVVGEEGRQVRV